MKRLRLYDTLTREQHEVYPADGETLRFYCCGRGHTQSVHSNAVDRGIVGSYARQSVVSRSTRHCIGKIPIAR